MLVPALNEQEVVVTTVSALLEQDYAPLEVVVVDDGSTDATFDRLDAAFDLVSIPIGTGLRASDALRSKACMSPGARPGCASCARRTAAVPTRSTRA